MGFDSGSLEGLGVGERDEQSNQERLIAASIIHKLWSEQNDRQLGILKMQIDASLANIEEAKTRNEQSEASR